MGPVGEGRSVPLDTVICVKHIVMVVFVIALPEQIGVPGIEHYYVGIGSFRIQPRNFIRVLLCPMVDIRTAVIPIGIPCAVVILRIIGSQRAVGQGPGAAAQKIKAVIQMLLLL